MKPRNESLYAECRDIAAQKLQIPLYKDVAVRHGASLSSVRQVISAMVRELKKSTNVQIHVEHENEQATRREV